MDANDAAVTASSGSPLMQYTISLRALNNYTTHISMWMVGVGATDAKN